MLGNCTSLSRPLRSLVVTPVARFNYSKFKKKKKKSLAPEIIELRFFSWACFFNMSHTSGEISPVRPAEKLILEAI